MFGPVIDYWLLRPFTHARNLATEEELNARAGADSAIDLAGERRRLQKLQRRLGERLPISKELRYLDVGCGPGGMALALANLGAGFVTGIDMVERNIASALENRAHLPLQKNVEFICHDVHTWIPSEAYDVVLSHEALEHIQDPRAFLRRLRSLVRPAGMAVLAFGPLFYSPVGDHMDGFFRVPIPWRGALFSEKAVLRLRREQFRPTDPAEEYGGVTGGLNLLRYSEFLRHVKDTGWTFDFLDVNPQLKAFPLMHPLSCGLTRIPLVQDYVAASVYAILRAVEQPFGAVEARWPHSSSSLTARSPETSSSPPPRTN